MKNKHQKHSKLNKADYQTFARYDIAVCGLNCFKLKMFSQKIIKALKANYNLIFVDEVHQNEKNKTQFDLLTKNELAANFERNLQFNSYTNNINLNDYNLALLNGNHFSAKENILIIDENRIEKLLKKIKDIDKICAIILTDLSYELPEVLKDKIDENQAEVFVINEIEKIANYVGRKIESNKPIVKGLVLAGGKSSRMGKDKGEIPYYGKAHKYHLQELLNGYCKETFISYQSDYKAKKDEKVIVDAYLNMGAFGAILSAFKHDPNCAWLVLACDLPLIEKETIETLINKRGLNKIATAYKNEENDFPEPLLTLYEPSSYLHLLKFMALGYACPRKVLINSPIKLVKANNPNWYKNVNMKEEYEAVVKLLKEQLSEKND